MVATTTTETHIPFQEFTLSSSPIQDDSPFGGYSPPCLNCPESSTPKDTVFMPTETWAPAVQHTPSQEDFVKQLLGATSHGRLVSHLTATVLTITRDRKE